MKIIVLFTSIFTANSQEIWNDSLSIGTHRRLDRTNSRYIPPQFGFGLHYLNLYVGNPAQLRTLTVSTSSAFTALPCEDCDDCGMRGSNLYNFSLSSGFTTIPCSAGCSSRTQCFSDRCVIGKSLPDKSSWSGYEVSDFAFHGGGVDSSSIVGTDAAEMFGFQLRFACQKRTRGFYNNVMDGILGLSPAPTSFLSQIHQAGKLEHRRFSLCFNTVDDFKRDQATGLVTFGGFKEELLATEMLYAKMIDGNDYKVNVKRIHFRAQNGKSVGSEGQYKVRSIDISTGSNTQASVDSSSPFLTFDSRLEEPFRAAWKEVTGTDFTEARLQLSESDLARMPTLLIELEVSNLNPDSFFTFQFSLKMI
jgi:Xylanase inhibitor N-terminal